MTEPLRVFDLRIPLKQATVDSYPDTEDAVLTSFLSEAVEAALSASEAPPACPHCESRMTALSARVRRKGGQPVFSCAACRRQFNRRTGTALVRLTRRDALPEFIRYLSWQAPYQ